MSIGPQPRDWPPRHAPARRAPTRRDRRATANRWTAARFAAFAIGMAALVVVSLFRLNTKTTQAIVIAAAVLLACGLGTTLDPWGDSRTGPPQEVYIVRREYADGTVEEYVADRAHDVRDPAPGRLTQVTFDARRNPAHDAWWSEPYTGGDPGPRGPLPTVAEASTYERLHGVYPFA